MAVNAQRYLLRLWISRMERLHDTRSLTSAIKHARDGRARAE
jgi:hypothetical protein